MNTLVSRKRALFSVYALLVGTAASLVVACGDDDDADDPTTIPGTGGSKATGGAGNEGGDAGSTATGGTSTGGTGGATGGSGGDAGDTGGVGGVGGAPDAPGGGGAGGEAGGASCEPQGEYECYPCAPTTIEQYLNQCSDAECAPFDNFDRIPGFDGTLPEL